MRKIPEHEQNKTKGQVVVTFYIYLTYNRPTSGYSQYSHHSYNCWIDWNDSGFHLLKHNASHGKHHNDNVQLIPPVLQQRRH